jgi:putative aminopeptidase FrvX
MDSTEVLLKELTEAPGVPGYESEVRAVIRRYLAPLTTVEQDGLGCIICKKEGAQASPRVMLAGHMDEIGFMVRTVTEEGFVRFVPLGGWWNQVMLAQRVVIKTATGDVLGLTGAKPPHIISAKERDAVMEKRDMYIDVGVSSAAEVQALGIQPGDPVVPVSDFQVMANGKTYLTKALDDRVGCALFIQAIQQLSQTSHPNTIFGVGTVQEEVGSRGAITSVERVKPDVAIILEVDIAGDLPGLKPDDYPIKLGKGPSVLLYDVRMIPNIKLRRLVMDTAKEHGIPVQVSAMEGGATDGAFIHIHAGGVPTLVLSVPTRHIHSHSGIIHRDDYDRTLQLLMLVLQKLDAATVRDLTA